MGVIGRDCGKRGSDGGPEPIPLSLFGASHQCLDLAEGLLDRIEVGGIRRQEQHLTATRFDLFSSTRALVHIEVVPDDDLAWGERGEQDLLDEDVKDDPIRGTVHQQGGAHRALAGQGCQQRGVLPMIAWRLVPSPLATWRPGIGWGHPNRRATLIDKHQLLRRELGDCLPPGRTCLGVPFTGGEGLFYSSNQHAGWHDTSLRR